MPVIWTYLFSQEPDERAKIDRLLLAVLIDCQIYLLFFIALPKKKKKFLLLKLMQRTFTSYKN